MLRKVSGLLRRGHGQDAAAPRSRLHTEDTDHDASGKGLPQARLPSRIFPDGPRQVSEEETFGEKPGRGEGGDLPIKYQCQASLGSLQGALDRDTALVSTVGSILIP